MEGFNEEKKPVFVTVYDRLFDMIADGTLPVGGRLPSEPKLAAMLGVSRMTLRQALALLHEDGQLNKVQGKGNFVTDRQKTAAASLERIGNPVYKCASVPLDAEVELEFHLEPPSEYEQGLFKRRTTVAVAVDRFYRHQGRLVAYSLSLMPIESVSFLQLDLNDKAAILQAVQHQVYTLAARSHIRLQTTWVGQFISDRYVLTDKGKGELNLIYEDIYRPDDFAPMVCNKHYMLPEICSIEINAMP